MHTLRISCTIVARLPTSFLRSFCFRTSSCLPDSPRRPVNERTVQMGFWRACPYSCLCAPAAKMCPLPYYVPSSAHHSKAVYGQLHMSEMEPYRPVPSGCQH